MPRSRSPGSRSRAVAVVVTLVVGTGCGLVRSATHAVTPQPDPPASTRWNASLWPPHDTSTDTSLGPHGIAWMAPGSASDRSIRVRVALHRAPTEYPLAWRIRFGKCDFDRGVFGPPSAYQPLTVDSTGLAVGSATIGLGFPTSGSYFVRVVELGGDSAVVVCGNLVPPH